MKALDFVRAVSDSLSWGDWETIEDKPQDPKLRKIIRASDLVLRSLQSDKEWPSLKKEGYLQLQWAQVDKTSTVTVLNGDDTIFLVGGVDSGPWYNGSLIKVEGYDEIYRIISYNDSNSFTLNKPWSAASVASVSLKITVVRDIYQMPEDYDRLLSRELKNNSTGETVELVDVAEMRQEWLDRGTDILIEDPTKFTIDGTTPGGNRSIRFNTIAQRNYIYSYDYMMKHPPLLNDDTEIMYPSRMMLSIVDTVVARLNRDTENAAKGQQIAQEALMERVRGEATPESGEEARRIRPNYGITRRRRRR